MSFQIWCLVGRLEKPLSVKGKGRVLLPDELVPDEDGQASVMSLLKSKHPQGRPLNTNAVELNSGQPPQTHPVVYDRIDAKQIKGSILSTCKWCSRAIGFWCQGLKACVYLLQVSIWWLMSCTARGSKTSMHGVCWPNWPSSISCVLLDRSGQTAWSSSDWYRGGTLMHYCTGCLGCTEERYSIFGWVCAVVWKSDCWLWSCHPCCEGHVQGWGYSGCFIGGCHQCF